MALTIRADDNIIPGSYDIQLKDIEIVDYSHNTKIDNLSFVVDVIESSGIETIESDINPVLRYDLMGRLTKNTPFGLFIENNRKVIKR